jgi:hypothetical protein
MSDVGKELVRRLSLSAEITAENDALRAEITRLRAEVERLRMPYARPAAWHVCCGDYETVTLLREHADAMAEPYGVMPIPLFYGVALTDAERAALEYGIRQANEYDRVGLEDAKRAAVVFRGLLERTAKAEQH